MGSQGPSKVCSWPGWSGKLPRSAKRDAPAITKPPSKWTHPSHCSGSYRGLDCLPPTGLLTCKINSYFLEPCRGGGGGGGRGGVGRVKGETKQETWNTEDHCLPAFEMKDGRPHFTAILSSCKAQVAPILSLCLDQAWRRAAPLYNDEAPLQMPTWAFVLEMGDHVGENKTT